MKEHNECIVLMKEATVPVIRNIHSISQQL